MPRVGSPSLPVAGRSSNWSGPAAYLRRTRGGFSPLVYSPAVWLNATTATFETSGGVAATDDADPVGEWQDQSGNARHVTITGTARPLLKLGIQNGLPVLRFDGVNDRLVGSFSYSGTALTMFLVARRIAAVGGAGNATMYLSSTAQDYNDARNFILGYDGGSGTKLQTYRNGVLSTVSHPGNGVAYLFATKFDGTNNTVYLNGTTQTPVASTGAFGFNTYQIGARWTNSGATNFDNFDLGEMLVYPTALVDADRQAVESYLRTKWATP